MGSFRQSIRRAFTVADGGGAWLLPIVIWGVVGITLGGGSACRKPEVYPVTPVIDSVRVAPQYARSGNDSVIVAVFFRDGNGDIGRPEGDTIRDGWIQDMRTGNLYGYILPQVDPIAGSRGIRGTLYFRLVNLLFCRPFRTMDTVVLRVWIRDRAGNTSNIVETDPIFLQCQ